jgi:deoxyribodipyrimidine photolyase
VISARACVRAAMEVSGARKVDGSRDTGVGMWVQELAWRDFYTHVLVAFPRCARCALTASGRSLILGQGIDGPPVPGVRAPLRM